MRPDPRSERQRVVEAGHRGDRSTARAGLDHPDPTVRAAALGALERLCDLDADTVVHAYDDVDAMVRRRAATAAGRDHGLPSPLLLLDDPDAAVVEEAAAALGEREHLDPGVIKGLCRVAASHPDPLCRESAVAALGALGDPAGLQTILAGTSDVVAVRRRAALALAAFDGPEVRAALARLAQDRDWQVRQAAEDLGAGTDDGTG